MSRQSDRRGRDQEVRISWLEDDMDRVDREFIETVGKIDHAKNNWKVIAEDFARKYAELTVEFKDFRKEMEAEFRAHKTETSGEVSANRKIMVAVLTSMLGVAIAIVGQILVMRGGS